MDRNRTNQLKNSKAAHGETDARKFSCSFCEKEYRTVAGLQRHTRKEHDESTEKQFPCTYCEKKFWSRNDCEAHLRCHVGEKPYGCTVCDTRFTLSGTRDQHFRRVHQTERPHLCQECGKGFKVLHDLRAHQRVHQGVTREVYSCAVEGCEKTFLTNVSLKRHARTHDELSQNPPHACTYCPKMFVTSGDLVRHVRSHTGEKPYICSVCAKGCTSSSALRVHVTSAHATERPHACHFKNCQKRFKNLEVLRRHLETHKDGGQRAKFECTQCGRKLGSRNGLREHMAAHKGGGGFRHECSYCPKTFARSSSLTVHVRTHTGEKPYACPVCDAKFGSNAGVWLHMKHRHGDDRPHVCADCGKSFQLASHLRRHAKTHAPAAKRQKQE